MKKSISIPMHVCTYIELNHLAVQLHVNQLHSDKIIFLEGHLEEGAEMSLYQRDACGST